MTHASSAHGSRQHPSAWYRLVAKTTALILTLQLVLTPGAPGPIARASDGEPPLPVTVVEPLATPAAPEPASAPPAVLTAPPGAQVVPVNVARTPTGPRDAPQPPLSVVLPVSMTLSATAAQEAITFTLTLTHTGVEPVTNLSLEAFLPEALHWPAGQLWQYQPDTRRVMLTLPPLRPGMRLSRSFRAEITGVPDGAGLQQSVELLQTAAAGTALAARATTRPTAPRSRARRSTTRGRSAMATTPTCCGSSARCCRRSP